MKLDPLEWADSPLIGWQPWKFLLTYLCYTSLDSVSIACVLLILHAQGCTTALPEIIFLRHFAPPTPQPTKNGCDGVGWRRSC